ncbi:hypothetical protein D3C81_2106900 [compost metagenome]
MVGIGIDEYARKGGDRHGPYHTVRHAINDKQPPLGAKLSRCDVNPVRRRVNHDVALESTELELAYGIRAEVQDRTVPA